jgi:hypothetical protein
MRAAQQPQPAFHTTNDSTKEKSSIQLQVNICDAQSSDAVNQLLVPHKAASA